MRGKRSLPDPLSLKARKDRQANVAVLWYQGYSKSEILEKIGCLPKELEYHLRLIKKHLTPKTVSVLEYRKNKVLNKINLVQRKAWEIQEQSKSDTIRLSALRVVISSQELEAKVEGVTQEKLVVGPEREADNLIKKAIALEEEAKVSKGDDGHKPIEELKCPIKPL